MNQKKGREKYMNEFIIKENQALNIIFFWNYDLN